MAATDGLEQEKTTRPSEVPSRGNKLRIGSTWEYSGYETFELWARESNHAVAKEIRTKKYADRIDSNYCPIILYLELSPASKGYVSNSLKVYANKLGNPEYSKYVNMLDEEENEDYQSMLRTEQNQAKKNSSVKFINGLTATYETESGTGGILKIKASEAGASLSKESYFIEHRIDKIKEFVQSIDDLLDGKNSKLLLVKKLKDSALFLENIADQEISVLDDIKEAKEDFPPF